MSEGMVAQMPGVVTMVITLNQATRQLGLQGPLEDKLFCFGMLELAKEAVIDHHKKMQGQILVARPVVKM